MTPNEILNYLSLWIPIIGGLGAFIIPFLYSMIKDAKTRRIEAQKPHLERQLELYTETCKIAVCLATTTDENEKSIAEKRFWELYWGELCMVENKEVEIQMKEFGNKLKIKVDQKELKDASYDLAHALRRSLESSWGIRVAGSFLIKKLKFLILNYPGTPSKHFLTNQPPNGPDYKL